jgi:hypothetical protein
VVKVTIPLEAPASVLAGYGAGPLVRLQRAATEGGVYANVTTIAVDGDATPIYHYEYWDSAGATTSWYRWRLENAAGSIVGEYSAPFQGNDPAVSARNAGSYASLDDLLLTVPSRPDAARSSDRLARMERALVEARYQLDDELGIDLFRHPQTGTEAFYIQSDGGSTLHVHEGIVTLDSLEVAESVTDPYEMVDAGDWVLETPSAGQPSFHIYALGAVARSTWPTGGRLVRAVGARGWPRVPEHAVKANIELARLALSADGTFQGGTVGPSELGRPEGGYRLPDSVWRLKRAYTDQFLGCWL